jgi:hypothetical protein
MRFRSRRQESDVHGVRGRGRASVFLDPEDAMHFLRSASLVLTALVALSNARIVVAAAPAGTTHPANPAVIDPSTTIDINQIRMFVTNTGSFAFDSNLGAAGFEFPKGSGKTAVFAGGPWLGAHLGGNLRLALSEYSSDYQPGSVVGGVPDYPSLPEYKVYKLNRVYPDVAARDAALADYTAGAVPHGGPPVSVLPDGSLDILGDQMLWSVFNAMNPSTFPPLASNTLPLGVEVQMTTFAFDRPGPLSKTIFLRYKIMNRSALNVLNDMIFGLWSDPDLGQPNDDLVGCDRSRSLGFVYNATSSDAVYGSTPPAVGYVLLRGPTPNVGGAPTGPPLGLTAFTEYFNGIDPSSADETYHLLQGLNLDGTDVVDPTTGLPTRFIFPGDPVADIGWIDSVPIDQRLMISSGPTVMAPGAEQVIDYAIVVGQGSNPLSSVSQMLCGVNGAFNFYAQGFQPPYPGTTCDDPTPTLASLVDSHAGPDGVTLTWYGADLAGRFVTLERSTANLDWSAVSSRFADGSGSIAFEDRDVTAGSRYGYRIAVRTGGADQYSGETWIDVPVEAGLALAGFRPNPSGGAVFVDFSLPSGEPASLRVFDIAGRSLVTREVGALGAGRHQVRLDGGAALKAGAYVVQISQSGRTVTRRGVIVR